MADDKPTTPPFLGLTLPSWAISLVLPLIVAAVTGWGTYRYNQGKAESELTQKFSANRRLIDSLSVQVRANTQYIADQKLKDAAELDEFRKKREDYADRMEQLLKQYQQAAPTPK